MIERQGGDPRVVDDYSLLPSAPDREICRAPRAGYRDRDAGRSGRAAPAMSSARDAARWATRSITASASIALRQAWATGSRAGQPLLELHHRDGRGLEAAVALCREAIAIGDAPPPPRPTILGEVR